LIDDAGVLKLFCQKIGKCQQIMFRHYLLLPRLIDDLHQRANAYRHKESDDQGWDGTSKQRLGGQQSTIGWFRDRLR
jgi:hypothetical protein